MESRIGSVPQRHAFLIFAHDKFGLLERLVSLLDDERNDLFIHVDQKADSFDASQILRVCTQSRVTFLPRKRVYWGDFSQVQAVLNGLAVAVEGSYSYYHILSGTDLPIRSMDDLHAFISTNEGSEFVAFNDFPVHTGEWLAFFYPFNRLLRSSNRAVRYTYARFRHASLRFQKLLKVDRTRRFGVEIRYGSDWYSISHDFATYLLSQRNEIDRIFRHSFNPVEYYTQTVLWNSPFREAIFDLNDPYRGNLRLIDFKRGSGSSPYTWTIADKEQILGSERFFARKFDPALDEEIIDLVYRHVSAAV